MEELSPAGKLPQPQAITDFLLYRLHRVLTVAGGQVTRLCEGEFGITRRQWRVLAMVAVHGPIGPAELASRSSLDRPTTSKALGELVAKDLLQRLKRPGDARYAQVALTASGSELYRRMFPAVSSVSVELLSPLDTTEVAVLDSLLQRIQAHADSLAERSTLAPVARRRGGSRRAEGG